MKALSKITFPVAVLAILALGAVGVDGKVNRTLDVDAPFVWKHVPSQDTVLYPRSGWKLRRIGNFDDIKIADSLLKGQHFGVYSADDSLALLSARDTIKAPDSLRFTDPFRYKYYVALVDSLTHVMVRDSLKMSEQKHWKDLDTILARADSCDWRKIDSIYSSDSTVRARLAFIAWYNSLSKEERKKYDYEQKVNRKMHEMDSLKKVADEKQAIKDSITENTPRILETFALPDSMCYKRIIAWTSDPDFHKMKVEIPDTSYNKYFYDYDFQRKDVGNTWLGVAGSPVQPYNYFKRGRKDAADFITPNEPWTYNINTLQWYNTKTPYTELAYWGTLIGKKAKESDNIHILTTQNILPELNFRLSFDRWGGGGMLDREESINKTSVVALNYLGKKYLMHFGFIHNKVTRQENGGITDDMWIRDTTIEVREIPINLANANSEIKKNSFLLEQQLRIPFTFINKIKARRDSTFTFDSTALDRDLTTAFLGHTTEFTTYVRKYTDVCGDAASKAFYRDVFHYGQNSSLDSQRVAVLDNKVFLRLQPWSADAAVSKLDVGVGDRFRSYYVQSPDSIRSGSNVKQNTAYLYAGAEGRIKQRFDWDAKADYAFAGAEFSDFGVQANAALCFYPFRRDRFSPLTIKAHFETSLRSPTYYQQHTMSNHFKWDNDFTKQSVTNIGGEIDIPYWRLKATVNYGLLANNIYYDTLSVARQNAEAMSVFSASLKKDFVLGILHLDNQALFQLSSKPEVVSVPMFAFNLRYYIQFVAAKDRKTKTHDVMTMQIGANGFYNTQWYAPAWNPNLGIFHNLNKFLYENGPTIDIFANIQWKRACIFLKLENLGGGWPMKHHDSFSAAHYIRTNKTFKIGIFWPFYTQPGKGGQSHDHSHGATPKDI